MPIIDDVKCPRCDRKYSGVRSRCPFCGARRIGLGKYSKDGDNAKGKMLISILILAVLTVAAGILLFTTPPVEEEEIFEPTPTISLEDEILGLQGLETPEPTPTPTPEPTPPPVESIEVMYGGARLGFRSSPTSAGVTQKVGTEDSGFHVRIEPVTFDGEVKHEISDESIFTIEWLETGRAHAFKVIMTDDESKIGQEARLTITVGDLIDNVFFTVGR